MRRNVYKHIGAEERPEQCLRQRRKIHCTVAKRSNCNVQSNVCDKAKKQSQHSEQKGEITMSRAMFATTVHNTHHVEMGLTQSHDKYKGLHQKSDTEAQAISGQIMGAAE